MLSVPWGILAENMIRKRIGAYTISNWTEHMNGTKVAYPVYIAVQGRGLVNKERGGALPQE